ncbi:Rv1733c family protein [Pseudonocardia xishanensis]|uniref:Integral membrane protein n=1 Tax=Pseudonocardia xishanensis TaxID=630995 RepID=A0ABP8RWQ9_9PSEU
MGPNRHADPVGAGGRRGALPHRHSDRVADLVAWALGILALGVLASSVLVGVVVHGDLADHAAQQNRERTPVTVVLTEDAPVVPSSSGTVVVGVRWTGPDGVEHTGRTAVPASLRAGDPTTAWVGPEGRLTDAPLTATEVVVGALASAAGALVLGGFVVVVVGVIAQRGVDRLRAAEWEREWRAVGPTWRSPR